MSTNAIADSLATILAISVRQDRIGSEGLKINNQTRGGLTAFKRGRKYHRNPIVLGISAPLTRGAEERTIRIHELLHANHDIPNTPAEAVRYHRLTLNAVADCYIHGVCWPKTAPLQAQRDCAATGLHDLRNLPPAIYRTRSQDNWALSLLQLLRGMTILNNQCCHSGLVRGRSRSLIVGRVKDEFGTELIGKLQAIYRIVLAQKRGWRKRAHDAFQAIVDSWAAPPVIVQDHEQDQSNCFDHNGMAPIIVTNGVSKPTKDFPMVIVDLPKPLPCSQPHKRPRPCRVGSLLNGNRLAAAVATGSVGGLYRRRKTTDLGTVLIDASGSMGMSNERLQALCAKFPGKRVAYYSNYLGQTSCRCYGTLCVYADKGKRAAEIKYRSGGNWVDLWALQWLLQQPGPLTLVSDLAFCGGGGQSVQAHNLLNVCCEQGRVEVLTEIALLGV